MIRGVQADEPSDFDANVRRPGLISVAEMAGKTPPWARELSLRVLRDDSPFVAHELHRQGRLDAGDVW